jgi:3',5'-cyclic AMP phosphodiesterase CpdA
MKAITQQMNDLTNAMAQLSTDESMPITVDGGIQEPFTTALATFKDSINADDSVLKIGLLQDIHYMPAIYNDEYGEATAHGLVHIQHMGALADKIDAIVYNGDNDHGRETKATTTNRIKQIVAAHNLALGDIPTLWTIGNHDDNNVYFSGQSKIDNTLTLAEMQAAYGINKTYSYQDFVDQKVRIVVMSAFENPEIYNADGSEKYNRSYNSVFDESQLSWLVNDALKVPAGYSVVAFMHCPPQGFMLNKPYANYQDVNHDLLLGILQAFVAGSTFSGVGTNTDYPANISANFTAQGAGALVGVICGHEHHDMATETQAGVRVIERTCNLGAGVGRTLNTLTEDAFDVIEIDATKRHCKLNRFGAGESLEFNY